MKKILLISLSIILVAGFVYFFVNLSQIKTIKAGTEHNVSGWVWSGTIGWISFNNTSGGGSVNYGVDINPSTGNLSDNAWSENIGWIRFDPAGPYPGAPDYSAKLDLGTNQITGWIRACAGTVNGDCNSATRTDGWDGWIKMAGIASDGSPYGVSRSGGDLTGFAWGSDVVGWVKFKGIAQNGSPYGGVTTFLENRAPSATSTNETLNPCAWGATPQAADGLSIILNWNYSDQDGDPRTAYEIWIDDDSNFQDPKFNHAVESYSSQTSQSYTLNLQDDDNGDWLSKLNWDTTYYWKVKVRDSEGNWSQFSDLDSFDMPKHAYPWSDFTHSPTNPAVNEVVIFTDASKCYSYPGNVEYNCKDGAAIQYDWDFDYIEAEGFTVDSTVKGNATTTYSEARSYEARLRITDNSLSPSGICTGRGDSPVGTSLPLPEWKEIPPF